MNNIDYLQINVAYYLKRDDKFNLFPDMFYGLQVVISSLTDHTCHIPYR